MSITPKSLSPPLRFVGRGCGLLAIFELPFFSWHSSLLYAGHYCYQQDNKATAYYHYINHKTLIIIQGLPILRIFNFSVSIIIHLSCLSRFRLFSHMFFLWDSLIFIFYNLFSLAIFNLLFVKIYLTLVVIFSMPWTVTF